MELYLKECQSPAPGKRDDAKIFLSRSRGSFCKQLIYV
jgi:hypothetical protein